MAIQTGQSVEASDFVFETCRVYQTSGVSLSGGVAIPFQAEHFDTDSMHDNSTNNTRITFNTAGFYAIGGSLYLSTTDAGRVGIRLNGSTDLASNYFTTSSGLAAGSVTTFHEFQIGDYIELVGTSNGTSSGDTRTNFWAVKIGFGS
ncbi:hypothetical protein [Parerythrobacter lacustris]|uniref:C1q domain-containing protein n=1 Tax=Parerythrobacter lacustris TaxID=2969984 RepID=A0ABT1XPF8_9SPHN|nr:hypothetical protein [Parerythrobacter lacustris]MCR2833472.1 hypothetical protein [Parerythrobacter lacustris]